MLNTKRIDNNANIGINFTKPYLCVMILHPTDIIDREKGKTAIVVALSSTLREVLPDILAKDKDNYTIISCNRWHEMIPELKVDYHVMSSMANTVKKHHVALNEHNCVTVYEKCYDHVCFDVSKADGLLKNDVWGYCCCGNESPTLQDILSDYTGVGARYRHQGTVLLSMLSLAVIMGCSKIIVAGADLDYTTGYVKGGISIEPMATGDNVLLRQQPEILEAVKVIADASKNIYNLTGGVLDKILQPCTLT